MQLPVQHGLLLLSEWSSKREPANVRTRRRALVLPGYRQTRHDSLPRCSEVQVIMEQRALPLCPQPEPADKIRRKDVPCETSIIWQWAPAATPLVPTWLERSPLWQSPFHQETGSQQRGTTSSCKPQTYLPTQKHSPTAPVEQLAQPKDTTPYTEPKLQWSRPSSPPTRQVAA